MMGKSNGPMATNAAALIHRSDGAMSAITFQDPAVAELHAEDIPIPLASFPARAQLQAVASPESPRLPASPPGSLRDRGT